MDTPPTSAPATDPEARRIEARADQLVRKSARVEEALVQLGAETPKAAVPPDDAARQRAIVYSTVLGAVAAAWLLGALELLPLSAGATEAMKRVTTIAVGPAAVLAGAALLERYVLSRMRNAVSRYNLVRVVRLLAWVVGAAIVVAFTFQQIYPLLVSLGVVSLVLGFALQTPLTSFFGWIYILVRAPFRVGDRIRIGEALGDVIELGYMDTTLWEVRGPHLSTNHPSGRVIRIPNSVVLNEPVYNYSWPLFPYIWSELKLQVAYDSDLPFVADTMVEVAEDEVGRDMPERVRVYRELVSRTPVGQLQISDHPTVVFRPGGDTWIEATLRFLVHPKEMGAMKTRLLLRVLERLNGQPDRVRFPKGNMR
jgi:small-conductance mechanosensitive channel